MLKIVSISRKDLLEENHKAFRIKKKGAKPEVRDQEALLMLIKAIKQQ